MSTTKSTTAKNTKPTATKVATKVAPKVKKSAKASAPAPKVAKAPTRKDLLASLELKGYEGPTSFTVTVLRQIVDWFDAGSPKDIGAVPNGVLFAVHPDLKPAPASKVRRQTKWQQGYQEALADVLAVGDDLEAIKRWIADNTTQATA